MAYRQSASTLNLLRAFAQGGYANLAHVHKWNMGFVYESKQGEQYEALANRISETLDFMDAVGINSDTTPELRSVDFYTSHESLLLGYENPPADMKLDDGVYYNKFMYGNKIKMPKPLSNGLVEYNDGTEATEKQMAKDVTTFLAWSAEPHLEARHKIGFKAIIYLIILSLLTYLSMKRLWSRIESKV